MNRHVSSGDPRLRLRELRGTAVRRAASLAKEFDAMVEAASNANTDDEHDPEGHTIGWERQQIAALLGKARITLSDIEAAEQRIDDGTYGTCATCGQEISAERLEALPATPTCISCARRSEMP